MYKLLRHNENFKSVTSDKLICWHRRGWVQPEKHFQDFTICGFWLCIFLLLINYIFSLLHIGWHHSCSELLLLLLRLWTSAQHGSCLPRLAA